MRRLIIDTDTASDDAVAIMMALADPVAMAVVLDESIAVERSRHRVDVALADELTRGMTVVDRLGTSGRESNAEVVFRIDAARWKAPLRESLA